VCFFSGSGREIVEAAGTVVRNLLESDTQYKVNKLFLIFGRQQAQHYYVKENRKIRATVSKQICFWRVRLSLKS
jgi:hypothetical protein